jgi:hypothetical protein
MSKQQKKIFWPALLAMVAVAGGLLALAARTRATAVGNGPTAVSRNTNQRPGPPERKRAQPRNLALQPEALKLSRKVGERFASNRREVSVMIGTLTIGREHQQIRIQREQNDRGERVDVAIGGAPGSLSWSGEEGPQSMGQAIPENDRMLLERLTFDSVDQFVLAQLRGASYYTVARNVMPASAGGADNYSGPTWDIVRVDDPEIAAQKRPLSKWRLYFINSQTGLIDKVISEVRGERIETNFAGWTEQEGEKFPTRITWTRQGHTIMEFNLNNFAHNSPQQ